MAEVITGQGAEPVTNKTIVDIQPGVKSTFGQRSGPAVVPLARRAGSERRLGLPDRRITAERRDGIRMDDDRRQNRGRRKTDQDVWEEQKKVF
ncbi:MAG: hypothetical protein LJE84_04870 [Gammaproteobacteria bacterium]|nr:hypothetical protein [Gammaproteobacteria bacterium]